MVSGSVGGTDDANGAAGTARAGAVHVDAGGGGNDGKNNADRWEDDGRQARRWTNGLTHFLYGEICEAISRALYLRVLGLAYN